MPDPAVKSPSPELRILKSESEVVEAIAQIVARLAVKRLQAGKPGETAAKGTR